MEAKNFEQMRAAPIESTMTSSESYLLEIALPTPLFKLFTYSSDHEVYVGSRVEVNFGRRKLIGVCLGCRTLQSLTKEDRQALPKKINPLLKIVDESPIFTSSQIRLAQWLEKYYFTPIGEILHAMLPASQQRKKIQTLSLSKKGIDSQKSNFESFEITSDERVVLKYIFGSKNSSLSWKTALAKLAKLNHLKEEEFILGREMVSFDTEVLKSLEKKDFVRFEQDVKINAKIVKEEDVHTESQLQNIEKIVSEEDRSKQLVLPTLTPDQKFCVEKLKQVWDVGDFKPALLFGITGSGKTELYLQLIEDVLSKNANHQILVMVPEIALTPQMTRIFETRFGSLVAVVHSAMENSRRWSQLQRIRSGDAKILIGPRSSVFAPFVKLELIIVDEEHDGSYKQQGGFAYHGRDVAVLRAKIESAKILLGSATPSLESYYNAKQGKYHFLQMLNRANRSSLPQVEIVQQNPSFKAASNLNRLAYTESSEKSDPKDGSLSTHVSEDASIQDFISEISLNRIRENFEKGFQTICLVNRRGYSYFVLDLDERKAVACECCSVSLTFHYKSMSLKCHYCDLAIRVKELLEKYPHKKFATIGFGSEQIEQLFKRQFADLKIQRLDSDTAGGQRENLNEILQNFRDLKTNLLIGTQILAKGHDFPKVTLIVLLALDQTLDFPDFRAGEKVFQLLVQASGRAGRGDIPGKVILETHRPDHPVVQLALKQDYISFAERELGFRQSQNFPPFTKMICLEFSSPKKSHLQKFEKQLSFLVQKAIQMESKHTALENLRVSGPSAPPIEVVRGRIRRTMLFTCEDPKTLHKLVGQVIASIPSETRSKLRMNIDVDPQFMM